MKSNHNRKWQIRAAVLGIFTLGFLAGALALNVYHAKHASSLGDSRPNRFEQMVNRLQLSPEQKSEVDQIMSETRKQFVELRKQSEPRFEEIRKRTDERMQAVLTPQQWQQWQQMTNESRQRRRQQGRSNQ